MFFSFFKVNAQSRVLHLTLQSHNETSDPINYTNSTNWINVKTKLAMIKDTIEFYQAKYNLQCESNFIRANISMDNAASSSTDLLQSFEEHSLIEVDPHNHYDPNGTPPAANLFNYADLAKLLDSSGITRIQTVGGFIYQSSEWSFPQYEDWTNYENGIQGSYFPNEIWTPQILWGGGTLSHMNDPFSLGVWHAGGATSNTYDQTNQTNLLNLGNGCGWVIKSNTDIDSLVNAMNEYTDYFTNWMPSDPNMYISGTVIFNFRYLLTTGYVEKVCEFIRKINPTVQSGRIIWQNLSEKYDEWNTLHPNTTDDYVLMCSDIPANLGIDKISEASLEFYPNPTSGLVTLQTTQIGKVNITDLKGKQLFMADLLSGANQLQLTFSPGIYLMSFNGGIPERIVIE